jgi:hypothetical protein
MAKNYTKDQMWILFERLPEELKDAIFAVKTSDEINDACAKNKLIVLYSSQLETN